MGWKADIAAGEEAQRQHSPTFGTFNGPAQSAQKSGYAFGIAQKGSSTN
jgi:hypothetical protein